MAKEIVEQVKNELITKGYKFEPGDNVAAFAITNIVARRLGLGIVYKPTGNQAVVNGVGYNVDLVASRDRKMWDVLEDGGHKSIPTWQEKPGLLDEGFYREPLQDWPYPDQIEEPGDEPKEEPEERINLQQILDEIKRVQVPVKLIEDLVKELHQLKTRLEVLETMAAGAGDIIEAKYEVIQKKLDRNHFLNWNRTITPINPE
jgi:hypothetical protein